MEKFKVGDLVERTSNPVDHGNMEVGDRDIVVKISSQGHSLELEKFGTGHDAKWFKLIKKGNKMNSIKQRIEALNNGWDKEADDLLMEIKSKSVYWVEITIHIEKGNKNGHIVIDTDSTSHKFDYYSQCEKNRAFKDALLWLADKAGLLEDMIGKRYYDSKENKIFEIRGEDKATDTYTIGSKCKYYADAHTTYSDHYTRINAEYLEDYCTEIIDPAECKYLEKDETIKSWRVQYAKEGDKAEVEIAGTKWEATLIRKI